MPAGVTRLFNIMIPIDTVAILKNWGNPIKIISFMRPKRARKMLKWIGVEVLLFIEDISINIAAIAIDNEVANPAPATPMLSKNMKTGSRIILINVERIIVIPIIRVMPSPIKIPPNV